MTELIAKFKRDKNEYMNNYYRKAGMRIGKNTHIFSHLKSSEPYLIEIGDGVTISTDVKMLTHDASIGTLCGRENVSDICGRIKIGDYTFIGAGVIIMCGVTIGNRCVVGAGAVVTKSIPSGEIWGGNPARKIKKTEEFLQKNACYGLSLHGTEQIERKKRILEGPLVCK